LTWILLFALIVAPEGLAPVLPFLTSGQKGIVKHAAGPFRQDHLSAAEQSRGTVDMIFRWRDAPLRLDCCPRSTASGRQGRRISSTALARTAAVLFGAICSSAHAQTLREITVTQSTAYSISFVPIYVALHNRYFEEEGFRVKLVVTSGGGPDVAALIAGQAQFTAAGPINQLSLFQQGQKTRSVASLFDRLTGNLVIRKDIYNDRKLGELSLDERMKALKGLKISVTRLGSLTDMVARSYLRRAGLEPQKDAMIVATTSGVAQIAALMQKQVDAVVATTPISEEMVIKGAGVMLINNTQREDPFFVPFTSNSILVMSNWASQNPELVKGFVRSIVKAEKWTHEQSAGELAKIMLSFVPTLDVKVLTDQIALLKDGIPTSGCLSQKGIEANFQLFEAAGLFTTPMQWTEIATNDYLPNACGS
jgi:NitT/TauT family transport system substrate-binding protein